MSNSPLCKDGLINRIEVFSTSEICNAYNAIGIDVSRFFKGIKEVELFECLETGYRFYCPLSTIGDAEFYENLSLNRKNYYSIRWEHRKILSTIKLSDRVLEIGSGFGSFLELLKNKGIRAEGIELNPKAIAVCEEKGLRIHNMLIDEFSKEHSNQFDVVCYFQVLEHITNVYDFIKDSLKTIQPNGKLIIGVPNNNPYLFVNDKYHTLNLPPHHAGLWNKKSLKSLEDVFNLKIESVYYEPLEETYAQFLKAYILNSNRLYSKILRILSKVVPITLKKVLCYFINGRNIMVVFRKTHNG
ncbi:methionine biosynthesis protein MetW [Mangrovimonas sp. AS39]|uniref:class I SAM-dependent methyltransferase n=1 Tax=Mangrovimonas futianensis TaxID=2895523 RepID=UPI001E60DDFA|nr:methionine biosynthesis protein MetW [Mangrovimonas futianensis]MCF1191242.1 methionine biosynthesis protein MetW [Mangrovimonas futianensis]MCF1194937.1 methionine biosynthesis protein MetW [Mangrovimonas futianensis]